MNRGNRLPRTSSCLRSILLRDCAARATDRQRARWIGVSEVGESGSGSGLPGDELGLRISEEGNLAIGGLDHRTSLHVILLRKGDLE